MYLVETKIDVIIKISSFVNVCEPISQISNWNSAFGRLKLKVLDGKTTLYQNLLNRRNKSASHVSQKTVHYFFRTFKIITFFMLRIRNLAAQDITESVHWLVWGNIFSLVVMSRKIMSLFYFGLFKKTTTTHKFHGRKNTSWLYKQLLKEIVVYIDYQPLKYLHS